MRDKPKHVGPKLKAIRQRLGLSQTGMLRKLNLKCCYTRISEFERGRRRAAGIPLEQIVDDEMELSF